MNSNIIEVLNHSNILGTYSITDPNCKFFVVDDFKKYFLINSLKNIFFSFK